MLHYGGNFELELENIEGTAVPDPATDPSSWGLRLGYHLDRSSGQAIIRSEDITRDFRLGDTS